MKFGKVYLKVWDKTEETHKLPADLNIRVSNEQTQRNFPFYFQMYCQLGCVIHETIEFLERKWVFRVCSWCSQMSPAEFLFMLLQIKP
jgi:hypothetical protein